MLDFLEIKTVYLIAHIFGAILGAGGAFASDAIFFSTIRDGRIDRREFQFMKLGSKLVWSGLILLLISGILLVSTDPAAYLSSGKFLAKITIVGIIAANGLIFHAIHLPHLQRHLGVKFAMSSSFLRKAPFLLVSGAVSASSWSATVILGMLKRVPYDYAQIMGTYLVVILIAASAALSSKRSLLHLKK